MGTTMHRSTGEPGVAETGVVGEAGHQPWHACEPGGKGDTGGGEGCLEGGGGASRLTRKLEGGGDRTGPRRDVGDGKL